MNEAVRFNTGHYPVAGLDIDVKLDMLGVHSVVIRIVGFIRFGGSNSATHVHFRENSPGAID